MNKATVDTTIAEEVEALRYQARVDHAYIHRLEELVRELASVNIRYFGNRKGEKVDTLLRTERCFARLDNLKESL